MSTVNGIIRQAVEKILEEHGMLISKIEVDWLLWTDLDGKRKVSVGKIELKAETTGAPEDE